MPTKDSRRGRKKHRSLSAHPEVEINWKKILIALAITAAIVLLIMGVGMLLAPVSMRRELENKNTGEDGWLALEEKATNYPMVPMQLGYCPKPELESIFTADNKKCYEVTPRKINRLLHNVRVVAHKNHNPGRPDPLFAAYYPRVFSKPNNPFKFERRKAPDAVEWQRLKTRISYALSESSSIAKRLAMIYLSDSTAEMHYYNDLPDELKQQGFSMGYFSFKHAMIFSQESENGRLYPHEFSHAGAGTIYKNSLNVTSLSLEDAIRYIEKALPCSDDKFLSIWQNEIEEIRSLFKSIEHSTNLPSAVIKNNKLLKAASIYEPRFAIELTEDDLAKMEKLNLLNLGETFDTRMLPKDIIVYMEPFYPEIPMTGLIIDKNQRMQLVSDGNAKLLAINYHTVIRGVASLEVTPKNMDIKLKLKYLMYAFELNAHFLSSKYMPRNRCAEAFGTMQEFKEGILRLLMPKSFDYIHQQITAYEEQQQQRQFLPHPVI